MHRVGNYHIFGMKASIRIANIWGYIIHIGHKIMNPRDLINFELTYEVISHQTLIKIEKYLSEIEFFATHLDLVPINKKIKNIVSLIKDRMNNE